VGVQVKLWNPLRTRAIPERFCGGDSLRRGAISSVCTFTFTGSHLQTAVVSLSMGRTPFLLPTNCVQALMGYCICNSTQ